MIKHYHHHDACNQTKYENQFHFDGSIFDLLLVFKKTEKNEIQIRKNKIMTKIKNEQTRDMLNLVHVYIYKM